MTIAGYNVDNFRTESNKVYSYKWFWEQFGFVVIVYLFSVRAMTAYGTAGGDLDAVHA